MENQAKIYIGCMTGTSADCVADFSAACFDRNGQPYNIKNQAIKLPKQLQQNLLTLSKERPETISIVERSTIEMSLTHFLADAFLQVINDLDMENYPRDKIILSAHGQTIQHQPNQHPPYTDILINGEQLASLTGFPSVVRHREAALTVCKAAPLAPVLIQQLFYNCEQNTILLNGGGIANIAVLLKDKPNDIIGYDTGPANGPIDAMIQFITTEHADIIPSDLKSTILTQQFDPEGAWARRGKIIPELLVALLRHPYFSHDINAKSADRADFDLRWVWQSIQPLKKDLPNILTTLTELVVQTIKNAILDSIPMKYHHDVNQIITYGGIIHNTFIMERLKQTLSIEGNFQFVDMASLGYNPDFFESLLFAYLGYCADQNIPIDVSYCRHAHIPKNQAKVIPGSKMLPPPFIYQEECVHDLQQ